MCQKQWRYELCPHTVTPMVLDGRIIDKLSGNKPTGIARFAYQCCACRQETADKVFREIISNDSEDSSNGVAVSVSAQSTMEIVDTVRRACFTEGPEVLW